MFKRYKIFLGIMIILTSFCGIISLAESIVAIAKGSVEYGLFVINNPILGGIHAILCAIAVGLMIGEYKRTKESEKLLDELNQKSDKDSNQDKKEDIKEK